MKIAHRLGIGFTVLLCLFGAYGLFTLDRMGALADLTDKLYNYPHAVSNRVLQAENHVLSINRSVQHLTALRDRDRIRELADAIEAHEHEIRRNFESIHERYEGDRQVLADARQAFDVWESAVEDIVQSKLEGRHDEANALLGRSHAEHVERLESRMRRMANLSEAKAAEFLAYAQTTRKGTTGATVSLLFLMIVLAGGLAFWLTRSIRTPLNVLHDAARRIADGDLRAEAVVDSNDEFRELADSFNEMVCTLGDALAEVGEKNAAAQASADEANRAKSEVLERQLYLQRKVTVMLGAMDRLAQGDLSAHLEVEQDDEIGKLYQGFNETVANVRTMLEQVEQAVVTAVGAMAQISSATETLAHSARDQSAQTDEVAAAVEEITRTIIENARNAAGTADAADLSREQARNGGAVVRQTIHKIRHIADVVSESSATIEDLGASSREIGEIVKVIGEIADQTNLLALNAAIEAARAGDHGRGFTVVADEVRKLAERTTQATRQIGGVIETIQAEVDRAVKTIHAGRDEVTDGIEMADQAGEALGEIVQRADEVGNLIGQIAAATEEQSATSEEISRTIEIISTVTSESAAGITQIAQASDELARLMNDLQHRMGRFGLPRGGDGHTRKNENVDLILSGDGVPTRADYRPMQNPQQRKSHDHEA